MPRSGTTLVYDVFSAHPDLGWIPHQLDRFPGWPVLSALSRVADLSDSFRKSIRPADASYPAIEALRIGPSEAYRVWSRYCGADFPYRYLLGTTATETQKQSMRRLVARVLRYQGKSRFCTKLTGPGRIHFLDSIFPDALFVHIVRDGRAVVRSLMKRPFWRDTFRATRPAWENGLSEEDSRDIAEAGGTPQALAAVQWRRVVRSIQEEGAALGSARFAELAYEEFVADPEAKLKELAAFCGLRPSDRQTIFLKRRFRLENRNRPPDEPETAGDPEMLGRLLDDALRAQGYEP